MPQLFADTKLALSGPTLPLCAADGMLLMGSFSSHTRADTRALPAVWLGNAGLLKCTRQFFYFEALDDVASLDVLIVLEGHTAFVSLIDLANLVFESLQGFQ